MEATWSTRRFMPFVMQRISVAVQVAAATEIRQAMGVGLAPADRGKRCTVRGVGGAAGAARLCVWCRWALACFARCGFGLVCLRGGWAGRWAAVSPGKFFIQCTVFILSDPAR